MPGELEERVATNPFSFTKKGAELFKVTEEQFTNWRWQMKHQVQTASDINLNFSEDEKLAFESLKEVFHSGITPYSASLIDFHDLNDPVRRQLLPSTLELKDKFGVEDPLKEVTNSPVKEVVHVYKDRVAFCVAQLCPVYCRYCFRKRRDGEEGLHFNPQIINKGLEYIAQNKEIRDVLLTGGDPLIAQDSTLRDLLTKLRAIKHVEIIRIGTRVPVSLPYRITEELASMLASFHPLWINTHFNSWRELTPEAASGIHTLLKHGIPIGNQSVLLKDINDSFDEMKKLLQGLVRMRVRPYYIYHPQVVQGTEHLRVPIEKGLDLMKALRGQTTGFSMPQYVLDTPSGKIPLSPQYVLGRDGERVVLEQLNGRSWAEPSPLEGYLPKNSLPYVESKSADCV